MTNSTDIKNCSNCNKGFPKKDLKDVTVIQKDSTFIVYICKNCMDIPIAEFPCVNEDLGGIVVNGS